MLTPNCTRLLISKRSISTRNTASFPHLIPSSNCPRSSVPGKKLHENSPSFWWPEPYAGTSNSFPFSRSHCCTSTDNSSERCCYCPTLGMLTCGENRHQPIASPQVLPYRGMRFLSVLVAHPSCRTPRMRCITGGDSIRLDQLR